MHGHVVDAGDGGVHKIEVELTHADRVDPALVDGQ